MISLEQLRQTFSSREWTSYNLHAWGDMLDEFLFLSLLVNVCPSIQREEFLVRVSARLVSAHHIGQMSSFFRTRDRYFSFLNCGRLQEVQIKGGENPYVRMTVSGEEEYRQLLEALTLPSWSGSVKLVSPSFDAGNSRSGSYWPDGLVWFPGKEHWARTPDSVSQDAFRKGFDDIRLSVLRPSCRRDALQAGIPSEEFSPEHEEYLSPSVPRLCTNSAIHSYACPLLAAEQDIQHGQYLQEHCGRGSAPILLAFEPMGTVYQTTDGKQVSAGGRVVGIVSAKFYGHHGQPSSTTSSSNWRYPSTVLPTTYFNKWQDRKVVSSFPAVTTTRDQVIKELLELEKDEVSAAKLKALALNIGMDPIRGKLLTPTA